MKRITNRYFVIIMAVLLCIGLLGGCGSSNSDTSASSGSASSASSAAETQSEPQAEPNEIVGTLEDITMNTVTMRVNDGRMLTFNVDGVEHTFSYGIDKGNWFTVIYTGDLVGTDTSNLKIIQIHDEETEHTKQVKSETTIQEADDTVYALEDLEVRSSYMMASEVVGKMSARDSVTRTGICNNGWDQIIFEGEEAYAYGSLLTTDANETGDTGSLEPITQKVIMKELDETVYAKTDVTVRQGYSTASKAVGAMKAGTSAKRTGICDNGWSRIIYNGAPAFVYTDVLTTKNPNTEIDGVKIAAVNETVFATDDLEIKESWSKDAKTVGAMKYGDHLVRTGICNNGWSRVGYNKKDAFIKSDLLSKSDPTKIKNVTIYKKEGYAWTVTKSHFRESYSASSKSLQVLDKGTKVKVTGITDTNWARIDYKGKTGFIHNDLLTSKDPSKSDKKEKSKLDKETSSPSSDSDKKKEKERSKDNDKPDDSIKTDPANEGSAQPSDDPEQPAADGSQPSDDPEQPTDEPEQPADEPEQPAADSSQSSGDSDQTAQEDSQATTEAEEAAKEEPKEPDLSGTKTIKGTVAGYDVGSITITVENDKSSTKNAKRPAEEPALDEGDGKDKYPSKSYDEAEGDKITYYTFDTKDAAQIFKNGVSKGLKVTIYYKGDLSEISKVKAVEVTDK